MRARLRPRLRQRPFRPTRPRAHHAEASTLASRHSTTILVHRALALRHEVVQSCSFAVLRFSRG
eukprot:5448973-Alexandrium_andersonii.AAC.1